MTERVERLERRRLLAAAPAPVTFGATVTTAVAAADAPIYPVTVAGGGLGVAVATGESFGTGTEAGTAVLKSNGDGTFTATDATAAAATGTAGTVPFAVGHLDGEENGYGATDFALFRQVSGPDGGAVIDTVGTTFLNDSGQAVDQFLTAAATADLAGDGQDDLAIVLGQVGAPAALDVFGGTTSGLERLSTLPLDATFASPTDPARQTLTFADLYGNGDRDLVFYDGALIHPFRWATGDTYTAEPTVAAAGDFAAVAPVAGGTGVDDVIVAAVSPASVRVIRNGGDGTLTAGAAQSLGSTVVTGLAVADLNEDGYPDLDVGSAALAGNGDGTFAAPVAHATLGDTAGGAADRLVLADVNGDGKPDLIGTAPGGGLGVLLNTTGVTARAATTVTLTTPRTTVRLGDLVNITALLSATDAATAPSAVPTGNVAFSVNGSAAENSLVEDGSTSVGQLLPLGTDTVTATYGGDDLYATAGATPITVTVLPVAVTSTVTVGASTRAAAVGGAVTLSAQVLPAGSAVGTILPPETVPTGTVTFTTADGTDLGTAAVAADGSAELTTTALPLGADTVSAAYTGDDTYTAAASTASVTITVSTTVPLYPTTVTVTVGQATATAGDAVELQANVASGGPVPTGTVTFTAGGVYLGTAPVDADQGARLTTTALPVGSVPITAAYAGDATHAAGTSANAVSVAVTAAADDDPSAGLPAAGGSTLPAAAVAGATVRGVVTVGAADPLVRGPAGVTVMLVPVGSTAAATTLVVRRASVSRSGTIAVPVRAALPATLAAATYAVQVAVVGTAGTTTFAAGTLAVAARTVDLTGSTLSAPTPATVRPGGRVVATLTLADGGTVAAVGRVDVVFTAAPAGQAAAVVAAVLATVRRSVSVRAGGTTRVRLSAAAHGVPAGVALYVSAAVSFTPKVPGTAATATLAGPGTFTVLAGGPT